MCPTYILTSYCSMRVCLFAAFQELQTGLERASHCVELSGSTAVAALLQVIPSTCFIPPEQRRSIVSGEGA